MACAHLSGVPLRLSAGAILVLSLAACGGGGGGGGESSNPGSNAQPSGKISLGGVVAKGLTGNATVRVLGIASNGTVDETNVLATGQTDDSGVYATTEFSAPDTYVVEVNAKTCADTTAGTGCSFHQDEKTNARQYLPTGFKMRAVVTTTPASKKVNITPFSEMAVAAAESTSGGLTAANANKGLIMANTLVGVTDLNAVPPTTLTDAAATPDQIRLAALLSAVSNVAGSSNSLTSIGCTSTAQGTPEATKCVVEKLASNATVEKFVGKDAAVTTTLNTQLTAVVADNPQAKALVTETSVKLTDSTLTVPTAPDSALSTAIDKVRSFFADLTSTVRTLLDSGATPGQGALLSEAHAFESAVTGVDFQSMSTLTSMYTLTAAAQLWSDFEYGSHVVETNGKRPANNETDSFANGNALGFSCVLKKADDTPVATTDSASVVDHVSCDSDVTTEFYGTPVWSSPASVHQQIQTGINTFTVSKTGPTAYAYTASTTIEYATADLNYYTHQVNNWTSVSHACPQSAVALSCNAADVRTFTGAVSTSVDTQGRILSIHIAGDLPDGFKRGTVLVHEAAGINNLAKSHVDMTLDVSQLVYDESSGVSHLIGGTATFSGLTTAYGSNGSAFESSIEFGAGSGFTAASDMIQHAALNLTMQTSGAKLVGTLDMNQTAGNGGTGSFTGSLFNLASSTTVPFISATLTLSVDNSHYSDTIDLSESNYQTGNVQFDGYVTAPGHPKLRLIMGAGGRKTSSQYAWAFDAYGTWAGSYLIYNADGSTKRDVSFTVTSPHHDGITTTTLSEAATGISIVAVDGVSTKTVSVGGTTVGVIGENDQRLTFTNGDFISLDFGTVLY